MPSSASVFPAFIRDEYQPGTGFAEFERSARQAADRTRQHFERSFSEVDQLARRALSMPRTELGALNLNVGQYREAAQAANAHAAALREIAAAASRAASRAGDTSEATRVYVQAARSASLEAEATARSATQQAAAMERLQTELNQTAQATARASGAQGQLIMSTRSATLAMGQQRGAYQQLGFQVQDVTQQIALGVNPLVILAQQGGQTAFALSQFGGTLGRVAGFLSGPWGAAILGGATILGFLLMRSREAEEAQTDLAQAADTLGRAQGLLGNFLDLTTGKMTAQNETMREAVRLTAILAQLEAARAGRAAGERLGSMRVRVPGEWAAAPGGRAGGEPGVPVLMPRDTAGADAFRNLVANYQRDAGASVAAFRREIESMSRAGQLPGIDVNAAVREAITIATGRNEIRTMRDVQRVAEGAPLPSYLRRPGGSGRRDRAGRQPTDQSEFGEDAGSRIANIVAQFASAPAQVEKVERAMRSLDDIASDLERRRPPNYSELTAQLAAARETVRDGLLEPYRQFLESEREALEIQRLINAGREEEAETIQAIARLEGQVGKLDDAQRAAIAERIRLRHEEARQAEIAHQRQAAYLDAVRQVRGGLESTIATLNTRGLRGIGDFVSGLQETFNQLSARSLVEGLFGDTFRELEDVATGRGQVRAANEQMAETTGRASTAIEDLGKAASDAAAALQGVPGSDAEADGQEVIVTGSRIRKGEADGFSLDPRTFMARTFSSLIGRVIGGDDAGAKLSKQIGAQVATALQGVSYGQFGAQSALGRSGTGAQIGGAIGNIAGEQLASVLGKSLGQFAGPLGSIVGGIAGELVSGALRSTPRASSTINFGADGRLRVASTTGTSSLRAATSTAADSALSSIERVAEALGATMTGLGSVSIGIRDGNYRVDTSGRGITKTKKGALDFGEDAEAAVRAATLDLIKDGILSGLRAGTQRLLQGAKDLDTGLERALKFEGVFTDLKRRLDPVGAALDELDKRFTSLRRVFEDAGASVAEFAELERLYGLERTDAVKQASESMTSALRGLLDDLTISNDALSLRDRMTAARAKYDPLAADVAAGKSVDFEAFAEAARAVEAIQRQISGSTSPYFELLEQITTLTRKALGDQESLINAASERTSPFGSGTAPAEPTVDAIDRLGNHLGGILVGEIGGHLAAVNDNLGTLIRMSAAGAGGSSFPDFAERRNF